MDMYKIKWTRLQLEIFRFLCIKSGQSMNVRGIARDLGVSPTAVSNALPGLEKEGLVKIERENKMKLFLIELNTDIERTIELKRIENLRQVYESGLVKFLKDSFPGCAVILFGSYSRGEDTIKSDIDIAVIGTKGKDINLTKFDKTLERTAIINFYASFKEIHKNLKDNILNGILLAGSIDL